MSLQRLPLRLHPISRPLSDSISKYRPIIGRQQSTASHAPGVIPENIPPSEELSPSVPSVSKSPHDSASEVSSPQAAPLESAPPRRPRGVPTPPLRNRNPPPKYDRGPLHPHQVPRPSDPSSREFVPGPFSLPRLKQTYDSTVCADLMTLFYQHVPYGAVREPTPQRLRSWNPEDSPYYENRPLRAPRGRPQLPLLRKQITFRNVPVLSKITISSLVPNAGENRDYLYVANMALRAITGVRSSIFLAKRSLAAGHRTTHTQKAGNPIAVGSSLDGETMWHFLSTLVDVVLPRIKDWKGIKGSSGDKSGNLSLGLTPEVVGTWPEIEINYDSYPPKMIPGMHITLHTTATNDRDARVLLSALGFPFDGKHRAKA